MSEYMNAPPPVYTPGPKNGTNGANVGWMWDCRIN